MFRNAEFLSRNTWKRHFMLLGTGEGITGNFKIFKKEVQGNSCSRQIKELTVSCTFLVFILHKTANISISADRKHFQGKYIY